MGVSPSWAAIVIWELTHGRALQTRLQPVRFRQQLVRAIWLAAWGLLAGSIAALVCAIAKMFAFPDLTSWVSIVLPLAAMALGFIGGLVWRRTVRDAAVAVDDFYTLKDRAATALEFSARSQDSPLHESGSSRCYDAPRQGQPATSRAAADARVLPYALATFSAALILVGFSIWNSPASASPARRWKWSWLKRTA